MNTERFAGKLALAVAAGCILTAGSALALANDGQGAGSYESLGNAQAAQPAAQASSKSAAQQQAQNSMPDLAAVIQQQQQEQIAKNVAAMQQQMMGQMPATQASTDVQQAAKGTADKNAAAAAPAADVAQTADVAQSTQKTMQATMQEAMINSGAIEEIQKKIVEQRMQENFKEMQTKMTSDAAAKQ